MIIAPIRLVRTREGRKTRVARKSTGKKRNAIKQYATIQLTANQNKKAGIGCIAGAEIESRTLKINVTGKGLRKIPFHDILNGEFIIFFSLTDGIKLPRELPVCHRHCATKIVE
jgi:hypothetical protein